MGTVYAEITLRNAHDVGDVMRGIIKEQNVHQTTVTALVDTGAGTLVINEELRQKLDLRIESRRSAELADGGKQFFEVTEPVKICWKDRESSCSALVLPNASETLLGAIPLEDMDLIIHPKRLELVGAHGDEILSMVK
jgi:clan AA aspartic protease